MENDLEIQQNSKHWFKKGLLTVISVPAFILIAAFIGFAGFARESGIDFQQTMLMSAMIWALPSLVVLVSSMATGSSLLATAIAVALSAVRLFPMTIALLPLLRKKEKTPMWQLLLASHFIAVTAWVLAMQKLPDLPRNARLPFFLGFCVSLNVIVLFVTAIAYLVVGQLPMIAAGSLFLLTPVYFLLTLWNSSRISADKLALIFGLVIGPVAYMIFPGIDLLITGLVGGTLAFLFSKFGWWFK